MAIEKHVILSVVEESPVCSIVLTQKLSKHICAESSSAIWLPQHDRPGQQLTDSLHVKFHASKYFSTSFPN